MDRDTVIETIHAYFGKDLLEEARSKDTHLANGIQILGKKDVKTIVVGVSATVELFEWAKKKRADMVLTKHPIKINTPNQLFDLSLQKRLRMVFTNDWTVGGYHYILDVHPEVGNVPLVLRRLKAKPVGRFFMGGWGYVAEFPKPMKVMELEERLSEIYKHPVFMVTDDTKKMVRRIGMTSGGGIPKEKEFQEILELRLDAYITGEISEGTVHRFKEGEVTYFACGHHAMEVVGPEAFAQKLRKLLKNNVAVEFINVWNEI